MRHFSLFGVLLAVSTNAAYADLNLLDGLTTSLVLEGERQFEQKGGALDPDRTLVPVADHSTRGVLRVGYSLYWDDYSIELRSRPSYSDSDEAGVNGEFQQRTEHFSVNYSGSLVTLSGGVTNFIEGAGYSWNPSNPFAEIRHNEKDNASQYVREGDPYFSAKLDGSDYGVRLLWTDFKNSEQDNQLYEGRLNSYAIKANFLLEASEVSATGALLQDKQFYGSSVSSTFGDQLELHGEVGVVEKGHSLEFVSTDVNLGPQTLSLYELQREEDEGWDTRLLLGGQYTFTDNTNVLVEYLYNGSGYSDSDWKRYRQAVEDASTNQQDPVLGSAHRGFLLNTHSTIGLFRQHYLFTRVAFAGSGDSDTLSLLARFNLHDESFLAGINKVWNIGDSWITNMSMNGFKGKAYSEYGWVPYELQLQASVEYFF